MKRSQVLIYQVLQGGGVKEIEAFDAAELSEIFVAVTFLIGMIRPLEERLWLIDHDASASDFSSYIRRAIGRELAPISFLEPVLRSLSKPALKSVEEKSEEILLELRSAVADLDLPAYRGFIGDSMRAMAELSRFESDIDSETALSDGERPLEHSLYRTFDVMDEFLGIEYERDIGMKVDSGRAERLYEGAGPGVQTSYATLLIALEKVKPRIGARVMDLGSGYGRVGFVIGLLRPDIQFTGYEFVKHRVEAAGRTAERAGISEHVRFITQDLSDASFEIPEADVYYMYDPFTESTYEHVFRRLKEIARRSPITIVTKGNAGDRFLKAVFGDVGWMTRERYDEGTLSLFRSKTDGCF